jgi:hypothetical protein
MSMPDLFKVATILIFTHMLDLYKSDKVPHTFFTAFGEINSKHML